MQRRTNKTHPFRATIFLPAGHIVGQKKRESIRYDRFRDKDKAIGEAKVWIQIGANYVIVKNMQAKDETYTFK